MPPSPPHYMEWSTVSHDDGGWGENGSQILKHVYVSLKGFKLTLEEMESDRRLVSK